MDKHPENIPLFGGLAGAVLGVDEFEVCEGLVLRKTYSHVMSPYILAFRRPECADRHHPGPWKTTRGGGSLDVEIEVALHQGARPTGMKWCKSLENWDMTSLKIKPPFLEMEWSPKEPDKVAAWELYIELLTRITTQPTPEPTRTA